MSFRWALIAGSLLAHGGLVWALGGIRAPAALLATSIEVTETTKPEPPPPTKVEPPPPAKEPETAPRPRAAKAEAAPPPEPAATAAAPALANLPDFGLELGGGGSGVAVKANGASSAAPRSAAPVTKTLRETAPRPADTCDEGPAKPKLLNLPRPEYTDSARAAGIEGKVRVELTVDESGKVVGVRALSSLGHGLDEAALTAARGATFEPAVRCGRPSRSTFTISIRFAAS